MAHLTINGVAFSVFWKSGNRAHEEQGSFDRMLDGTLVTTRTVDKRKWEIASPMFTRAEADAWEGLLLGRGDTWKFSDASGGSNHGYSSKGYAPATSGTVTFNVASGYYSGSKKVQIGASSYARWTLTGDDSLIAGGLNPKGDYTLVGWVWNGSSWDHWITQRLDGAATVWYKNGAPDSSQAFWSVDSTGYVQLGDGTNAKDFSDFTALPFAVPTSWMASIYAFQQSGGNNRPFPKLPRLEAMGDLVSNPTTPLIVRALGVHATVAPHAADTAGKAIEFTMAEV